jgi:hypothetical protein
MYFFNLQSLAGIHLKVDNCCISPYIWVKIASQQASNVLIFREKKIILDFMKASSICYEKYVWKTCTSKYHSYFFLFFTELNHNITIFKKSTNFRMKKKINIS